MTKTISIDAFTLLEFMLRNSTKGASRNERRFLGTIQNACQSAGLKTHEQARASYTRELKDAGLICMVHRQWIIDLDCVKETAVRGVDGGNILDLIPDEHTEAIDLTVPVPVETPEVVEEVAHEAQATPQLIERLSNAEIAAALAQELFNRLDAAEQKIREAEAQKVDPEVIAKMREEHAVQVREAENRFSEAEHARQEAERKAMEMKVKAEKLELQVAQLMKEMASADGDGIREAALRFFRPNPDDGGSVASPGEEPRGAARPPVGSQPIFLAPRTHPAQTVNA